VIAYVTYEHAYHAEDPDQDLPLFLAACQRLGVSATAVRWDDPSIDWRIYDCAIVRSTWDYLEKYDKFRAWLTQVDAQTTLLNPREVIEGNLNKTYLRDLGVPIVPTTWITTEADLSHIEKVWNEWMVIKPTVSAGARDTIRTNEYEMALAHARLILNSGRSVMVQPYLDAVDTSGEISIVCIDGKPSWSVRKIPALTQGGHGGSKEAVPLSQELIEFANHALKTLPGTLYARVDVVPSGADYLVMELELAEPSLFLPLAPADGADQLIAAITRRIAG
jgi:glutathione synthase/RimK-type ligase-like ATP-grasp enzyme